ncbi:MAG: hypothetical protein KJ795_13390 [Gammaproteobacteria bacterium]|nr:hypothetical protein [Gammaproteobacteria bacterium]MBU1777433.1 hypothetical protein [Gammaproteobacteria bacterium]MBU1968372.1 hypothetical protein [Gammaproteobacteria bacterium]
MTPLAQSWLLQSAVIFLIVGSLVGLVAGALLLYRPHLLQKLSSVLNRWVSTRHLDQSLERSVSIDPWFYRYRYASGTLTLLGALYILYYFTVKLDREQAIIGLSRHYSLPPSLTGGLLDALVLSSLLGALLALLVSLFLLLRPSLLRDFEQGANQWLSLRRALKPAEMPRAGVDEYVYSHGRQVGMMLVLGSLYVLVFLLSWIGH